MRAFLACCLLAAAAPAGAQPAKAQAEVLFREGRALLAAGKTTEACTAFEQSQELDPAVTTLLNLAGCREKLGKLATAWGLFLEAERQTRSARDDATAQLHKIARDRAAKIEPRVPKLTIRVPDEHQIDGLEILRDGEAISAVNRALPVDGGTYTITARAKGVRDWSKRVTIADKGETLTVEIPDLRTLEPNERKPARTQTEVSARPGTGRRSVPPILVGTGAALVIAGGILVMIDEDATLDSSVPGYYDTAPGGVALLVSGAVMASVGVYLWVRSSGRHSAPTVGHVPGGGVIGWTGRF